MALTLHLSKTLQSMQTISAWRSGTEEWIGHDLAVYHQAETLCAMLDGSRTCPRSVFRFIVPRMIEPVYLNSISGGLFGIPI